MRELGLAGEDLIRKVLTVADDFDRAIDTRPAAIADDSWFEGISAIDRKLRVLLESEGVSTDRCVAWSRRSTRASTRRSPTSRAPGTRTARSSRRSVAATGCEIASSARRSSPWRPPAEPND